MAGGKSAYSTGFASGKIDHDLNPEGQMKQFKREEKESTAPNILPYELGALPNYYAEIVDNAISASKTLENLLRNGEYENDKDLQKLKNNTDKMIIYLSQNVDQVLDKFTIGDKVDPNEF